MMSHKEYRDTLKRLNLDNTEAAQVIGVSERTSRRYADGDSDVPAPVAKLLMLIVNHKVSIDTVKRA
jgi:hypothetical protein